MKKEGYRRPGLFGSVNTYDNNGHIQMEQIL